MIKGEWSTLKKLAYLNAVQGGGGSPVVEATAEGNPLTFQTNLAKPLKSLLLPFTPVQSGSGDPSPSNVRPITGWTGATVNRTGKNLYNGVVEEGYISDDGTIGIDRYSCHSELIRVQPGQTYSYSIEQCMSSNKRVHGYDIYGNWVQMIQKNANAPSGYFATSFTVPNNVYYIRVQFYHYSTNDSDKNIQIELGSSATPYSPYTGTTYPVTFPATGKNLLNINGSPVYYKSGGGAVSDGISISNNVITVTNAANVAWLTSCEAGQTYTFKISTSYVGGTRLSLRVWYLPYLVDYLTNAESDMFEYKYVSGTTETYTFTVPSGTNYVYIGFYADSNLVGETISNLMLNAGSTAETYEPYTNIIYGGSVDVVTGVLTATMVCCEYDGSSDEAWDYAGSNPSTQIFIIKLPEAKRSIDGFRIMCNQGKQTASADVAEPSYGYVNNQITSSYNIRTHIVDTNMSVSDFKTYLSQHPLQIVCPLTTPITFQLSPTEIQTLIGANTVWSDTNGSNTAVYLKKG